MDAEPRAPYRERLALLVDGGVVEGLLDRWAAERSLDAGGGWQRIYGKLRPQRSPWALLIFQATTGVTVAARLLEPDGVDFVQSSDDPALPGLRPVLAALVDPRLVRYHPGNRCI